MTIKIIDKVIKKFGYSVKKMNALSPSNFPDIKETEFWDIYEFCKPYTMTSVERMYGLYSSVNYVLQNNISGVFVECGVWRGGSAMMIAKMLANRNMLDRKIFLYDTFSGMPIPTADDINISGREASDMLKDFENDKTVGIWCVAGLNDVQENMRLTCYPQENIFYVEGKVEDTIPGNMPVESIALLRLDTDWYESTRHELEYLFPGLVSNGVIIIDDYGHWAGCKKAVDEYFEEHKINILLNRVDYTCRVGIKTTATS